MVISEQPRIVQAEAASPMTQDEEWLLVHTQMGNATMAWSLVELQLGRIASACAQAPLDGGVLLQGFFAIDNFRSKLAFLDALLGSRFTAAKPRPSWMKLRQRVETASSLRNKIAHGHFRLSCEGRVGRRVAIVPPLSILGLMPHRANALHLMDIESAGFEFNVLSDDLDDFFTAIGGSPALARQKPPRRRTLQELREEVREALAGHTVDHADAGAHRISQTPS